MQGLRPPHTVARYTFQVDGKLAEWVCEYCYGDARACAPVTYGISHRGPLSSRRTYDRELQQAIAQRLTEIRRRQRTGNERVRFTTPLVAGEPPNVRPVSIWSIPDELEVRLNRIEADERTRRNIEREVFDYEREVFDYSRRFSRD